MHARASACAQVVAAGQNNVHGREQLDRDSGAVKRLGTQASAADPNPNPNPNPYPYPYPNKGHGVAALLRHLEVDPAETMACGDAENGVWQVASSK